MVAQKIIGVFKRWFNFYILCLCNMSRILVTGGAGFIGSNLVKKLLLETNYEIIVFDNLSSGRFENLPNSNQRLKFFKIDLTTPHKSWPSFDNLETIYHLAANADVRGGQYDREIDFVQNVQVTKSIADYARLNKVSNFAFASSATVYGEPTIFPTPENIELIQTSAYGASKLCGEALLQAYAEYGDFKLVIFRFVSWIGRGYSHGVIYDFYKKLLNNPSNLEILGDGQQLKSYLDVEDGIRGVIDLTDCSREKISIYNLGHTELMRVTDLADILCRELNILKCRYNFTGGKRGWIGDSPLVHLDVNKALQMGWKPSISIENGIISTLKYLSEDNNRIFR